MKVHYRLLCLMLANESILLTIHKDVNEMIDSLRKREDLLRILFPTCSSQTCKHHILSLFLQLVTSRVIFLIFFLGDKKYFQ